MVNPSSCTPKLTKTRGIVLRHQRTQWEYEARLHC